MTTRKKVLLGVAGAAVCAALVWAVKEYRHHYWAKRFRVVEADKLYRGGLPEPGPLRRVLETYGIKTLVNLAEAPPEEQPDARALAEERIATEKGVAYHSFRMPGDGRAEFDTLEAAAAILAEPDNHPVFFHCAGGKHRTNAVLAVMRMKYQDWPLERALRETEKFGLDRGHHAKLVEHLRRYHQERIAGALAAVGTTRPDLPADPGVLLPAETLFAYVSRPLPGRSDASALSALARGMTVLAPSEGKVWIRLLSSLTELGRYPFAVGILTLDVKERERAGSYKLKNIQLALIVRTGGDHADVIAQVDTTVKSSSSDRTGKIVTRRVGEHSFEVLMDHRLPAWCETQFGSVGDHYIVGFGAGTFEKICAVIDGDSGALSDDEWYVRAGAGAHADQAFYQLYGNLAELRRRLEPVLAGRPAQVAEALGLGGLVRFRWALGFEGRGHRSLAWMGYRDEDSLLRLSDPSEFPEPQVAVVPKQATGFSITRLDMAWLSTHVSAALLASLRPDKAKALGKWWADVEREGAIDFQRDLLPHLGPHMILHNYPRPVGPPFLCTVLLQHDGSPLVRTSVNRLLSEWQRARDRGAEQHKDKPAKLTWRWQRDPDSGIWSVKTEPLLGLSWYSVAVTERYIIISWSPKAVSQNLPYLEIR